MKHAKIAAMLIRKATITDKQAIIEVLAEADLHYPGETFDNFWVAEDEKKVIGIARLEKVNKFYFLTSLGVRTDLQHKGVASAILKELIKNADNNIYLYTIIPEFFQKFGFKITETPSFLPPKAIYGCEECFPEKCYCMVKLFSDPPISKN